MTWSLRSSNVPSVRKRVLDQIHFGHVVDRRLEILPDEVRPQLVVVEHAHEHREDRPADHEEATLKRVFFFILWGRLFPLAGARTSKF